MIHESKEFLLIVRDPLALLVASPSTRVQKCATEGRVWKSPSHTFGTDLSGPTDV